MNTLSYIYGNKIYINLTNECSNSCDFCIRNGSDGVGDYYLWLDKKPTATEVIKSFEKFDLRVFSEAVFCGFGEPLYALDTMIEVADWLKARGMKTRLNTNGQAKAICGEGTAKKLLGRIDTVSISLNAASAEGYNKVCHPVFDDAYSKMLAFAAECKREGIRTVLSVVDVIGSEEVEKCRQIANDIGVEFRVRQYVKSYEA